MKKMSWRRAKLGEVCRIEKGSVGIQKAIPGEYPLVVTGEERKSHNEFQFDDEAVIIPLVSGTGHGHASMKRIHFQKGKFALGSILCAVIPKNRNEVNAEYLYRYLDLNKENELVARMKGMANVSLPIKEIALIEIPLPPLEKQIHFVEKYKKLEIGSDLLSTELNDDLSLISQLRQSFLREAMQGRLLPQNPSDGHAIDLLTTIKSAKVKLGVKEKPLPPIKPKDIPYEIPVNWMWSRLGDICIKIGSGSTPKGSNYSTLGIPFFRSQNVNNDGLVYDDIKFISDEVHKQMNGTVVYANDILLNITGGSLGRTALVPDNFEEGNVSQHVCIIRPIVIDNTFLHNVVLSPFFQKFIFTSTTGSGREGLPKYNLEQFPIPVPPLLEQHRIVAKLNQLMQTCDALEASIKQSKEQNEKLLQQVLREALNKN